ncbi:nucleotidyltransferase domain-containing protein [Draconibacterium mangrovi]|uniref:nucleotidyltransferase domain-containing protein n=1 Tax=Draconibacterium mangrovi TaxID=2697469 RepID=UPI0013D7C264|nr:nucleotidyltransferase [Draconibacterium mangrovi]
MKEHFKKFNEEIKLTSNQREDAKSKYTNVCKTLHNAYYESIYDGKTKLLFGSYKTKTNTRPLTELHDVDVIFKITQETFDKFYSYQSNGPAALLQEIKDILKKTYTTTDKIRGWAKVVLVKMADNTHNVEVLPALEKEDGTFTIPNSTNGGSWENFDPRKQIGEFQASNNKTNGLTAELVRMMKSWKRNVPSMDYPSHLLINDVIGFLKLEFTDGAEYDDYQEVVKNLFDYIKARCYDESRKSHIQSAYNRAVKAIEYMDEDKQKEASDEWRKIFGDKFPKEKENHHKKHKHVVPPIIKPASPWSRLG